MLGEILYIPFIAGIFIIAVSTTIYLIAYKIIINKRLDRSASSEKRSTKPLMSPLNFIVIISSIFMSILLVLTVNGLYSLDRTKDTDEPIVLSSLEDNTFVNEYYSFDIKDTFLKDVKPTDEIGGYKRFEKRDGNFLFTYYISNYESSQTFPDFLIHAEYIGKEKPYAVGFYNSFQRIIYDDNKDSTKYKYDDTKKENTNCVKQDSSEMWFAGRISNVDCYFTLKYFILSEKQYKELEKDENSIDFDYDYSKYSTEQGKLVITYSDIIKTMEENLLDQT